MSRKVIFIVALLCSGCEKEHLSTTGVQAGAHPPGPSLSETVCEDTFPPDPPADFTPEFGGKRPTREEALPQKLSKTGLYTDIVAKEVHPAMRRFQPQFQLWSDGAEKRRWAYIPECADIDTSNMDDWRFPVGTRFFKEFSVDGRRIETSIIERIGEGPRDFVYASYQWNDSETEAHRVAEEGVENAHGTNHDIPSKTACLRCHGTFGRGGGRPSRALGFSAVQLSHSEAGANLSTLKADGKLSHPPDDNFIIPGDAEAQAALGLLHANCGNCHNDTVDKVPQVDLSLWLNTDATTLQETASWQTAVDQPTQTFKDQHVSGRIVSGNPDGSAILYRMLQRGNNAQMPPLATHSIDADGTDIVRAWIGGLR